MRTRMQLSITPYNGFEVFCSKTTSTNTKTPMTPSTLCPRTEGYVLKNEEAVTTTDSPCYTGEQPAPNQWGPCAIYIYMPYKNTYITCALGNKPLSEFPWISSSLLHDLKYCSIPFCLIPPPTSATHHDRIRQHYRQWSHLQRTDFF